MEAKVLMDEASDSNTRRRVLQKSSEDQPSFVAADKTEGLPMEGFKVISKLAVCTVSGMLFGLAAEKGQGVHA